MNYGFEEIMDFEFYYLSKGFIKQSKIKNSEFRILKNFEKEGIELFGIEHFRCPKERNQFTLACVGDVVRVAWRYIDNLELLT